VANLFVFTRIENAAAAQLLRNRTQSNFNKFYGTFICMAPGTLRFSPQTTAFRIICPVHSTLHFLLLENAIIILGKVEFALLCKLGKQKKLCAKVFYFMKGSWGKWTLHEGHKNNEWSTYTFYIRNFRL